MPAAIELHEFRKHGGVVVASLLGIAAGLAPLATTYTLGVLLPPLSAEFGWSRAQVLSVTVLMLIALIPATYAVGWLVDRYGVRRVVLPSQIGLGASFAALGLFLDGLATLYSLYVLMAVAGAGTLPVTFAKSVTAHFARNRGLALGVALSGTGLAGFLVPLYTGWLVSEWGWREAYLGLAALPLCIGLPVSAWLLEDPPRGTPATVAGGWGPGELEPPPVMSGGVRFADALRGFRFWVMAAAFFGVSGAVTGIVTNLVPLLQDRGLDSLRAVELASLVGLSVIGGRLAVGFLVDRLWGPAVGAVFLIPAAAAALALTSDGSGTALTAVLIVIVGLAVGAEIDLNAYLVSRYFGLVSYGRIYGLQYLLLVTGAALATPAFGWVHDRTGDYDAALIASAAALAAGGTALLLLGRYPTAHPPRPFSR